MTRHPLVTHDGASGFIVDWMVTGFFPNGTLDAAAADLYEPKRSQHWNHDYLSAYGGAAKVRGIPAAKGIAAVEWLPLRAPEDYPKLILLNHRRTCAELDAAFPSQWDHQWYALAVLESRLNAAAELRITGHDGCQVWFNGVLIHEDHSWHKLPYDLHTIPVQLKRGKNILLVKLDRLGVVARLTAPRGRSLKGQVCTISKSAKVPPPTGTFAQLTGYARTLKVQRPCPAGGGSDVRRWQRFARGHFQKCIGPFPERDAARRPESGGQVECDGYIRYRYHLPREAGSYLPVYVLIPDADRKNGRTVICPHGHGPQDDKMVAGVTRPVRPFNNWIEPYTGNYAERLAQAGFVTATWAERAMSAERMDRLWEQGSDACAQASLMAQAMGMTLPGLHLFDLHGVTDFVTHLPGVDPQRLGLMGLSGGATMTYLAGAYDERFKAVAPFCGIFSYADYAAGREGCAQQVVPGLYPTLDVGELLALIAPRPLLLGQGRKDVLFSPFTLQRFAKQARRVYRALGAESRLSVHLYDLAHQVDLASALRFFTKYL